MDMFPKIESDLTVRTERGGLVTIIGYCLVGVLVLAEWWNWSSGNNMTVEHVVVDTRYVSASASMWCSLVVSLTVSFFL